MIRSTLFFAVLCLTSASLLDVQGQEPALHQPQTIAIRAARLINGKNDGQNDAVMRDAIILVDGEKITAVGSGLTIPKNAVVIDLGDVTLLPGLIDAHTHLLLQMDGTNVSLQDIEMLRVVTTESTA
jgi:imidazolonepropionase-like amidohydrolase